MPRPRRGLQALLWAGTRTHPDRALAQVLRLGPQSSRANLDTARDFQRDPVPAQWMHSVLRMNTRIGFLRPLLCGVDLFMAIVATGCGIALIVHPQNALGMTTEMLGKSPFSDFTIPGLLLAGVIGGFYFVAGVLVLRRHRLAVLATGAAGIALMTWISVQVMMVPRHFMQPAMFAYGAFTAALAAFEIGAQRLQDRKARPS